MKGPSQTSCLKILFGKGRIEVLYFIEERGRVRFADIRKFCLEKGIVRSRGTVPIILRNLTNIRLIERKVVATRPVQIFYELTSLGKQVVGHLKAIEELLRR